ncbi:GerMN domain-containing protein [Paenibacillus gallinarum]|uniref:GerMN domain-containing protein n=1 Tax=Paenibacillus gallinarum TaxID=2762232 RepID=A0ABR8SX82_9BACL|nr:GerMN domain-containing protein [Paenibacillus gallinarum]MBD7968106.1 GerMN domain-containing protein [Paenibacillus gallinarum]
MNNKKWWMITLLAAMLLVVTACGADKPTAAPSEQQGSGAGESDIPADNLQPTEDPINTEPSDDVTNGDPEGTPVTGGTTEGQANGGATAPSEETKQETITLYYTDPEQLELKETKGEITFKTDWSKYEGAFKALQKSDSEELIPLWSEEITINKLEVDGGKITLDLKIPATANLGSGGEQFALDALKQTFFQFDEVTSLELLVDGEQKESLMGHVELEHPMTKE